MTPPAGGRFVVKGGGGSSTRFEVSESGEVYVPNLPTALAGKPLCWNQANGMLGVCPETQGKDSTPPTIEGTAPSVATAFYTYFPFTYSDNVELAFHGTVAFPEGTKSMTVEKSASIYLGDPPRTYIYTATDTSGNVAKKTITIAAPETGLKKGTYQVIGSQALPAGFNCLLGSALAEYQQQTYLSTASAQTLEVLPDVQGWSAVSGYKVAHKLTLATPDTGSQTASWYFEPTLIALSSIAHQAISSMRGNYTAWHFFESEVRAISGTPQRVELDVTMNCNIYDAGWISGSKATFTAELI